MRSANLEYITECISEIDFEKPKSPQNNKQLKTIERFLNREYGSISTCMGVTIADNDTNQLYGMQVFPTNKGMSNLLSSMQMDSEKPMSSMITEYTIEIDSKIGSLALGLRDDEITAILIHEIGHIVLDSRLVSDIQLAYLEARGDVANYAESAKTQSVETLYVLAQLQKAQLVNSVKAMQVEMDADKFVVQSGYGVPLQSALTKFSRYFTRDITRVFVKRKEVFKEMALEAKMFAEYAKSFDNRKQFIQDTIKAERKTTIFQGFKDKLDVLSRRMDVNPRGVAVKESLIGNLLGLKPNVGGKLIDTIKIEVEMVDDYDDKLYLIRKIHKNIKKIDDYVENTNDKRSVALYLGYRKELNSTLKSLMAKKIVPKQYGVFLKYPKEYEG